MSRSPQITVPKEHERGEPPWKTIALIIALLALMIIVAYSISTVITSAPKTELEIRSEISIDAENPELTLFRSYNEAARARAEITFLANNPEFMILQRYADIQAAQGEADLLAQNPELAAARRYTATIGQHVDAAFLARNPEIKLFRRYLNDQE